MVTRSCAPVLLVALLQSSAFLLLPAFAAADVIYAFGSTRLVDDPGTTEGTIDPPIAFAEGAATDTVTVFVNTSETGRFADIPDGPAPLCEDPVTGANLVSDFVVQRPADLATNSDVLVFSGRIHGIIHQRDCMLLSDDPFAHPGVSYPGSGGLGITPGEGDVLELFESRRTLFHELVALSSSDWDGYRLIVEAPPADRVADVRLDCAPIRGTVGAGDTREVTFRIENDGRAEAPDVQIVFRVPDVATVTNTQGSFTCADEPQAGIQICTFNDGSLRAGEGTELKVTFLFDAAPTPGGGFVGFGSGAVHDGDLTNNECPRGAVGPGADGGTDGGTDAGLTDGAVVDGSWPPDTGSGGGGGPSGSDVAFRGAGGCACEAATTPEDSSSFALAALVIALLVRRPRRYGRAARK